MTTPDRPDVVTLRDALALEIDRHWLVNDTANEVSCTCHEWTMTHAEAALAVSIGKHLLPFSEHVADALIAAVHADATRAADAEVAGLRAALASWVREDPWVPGAWSGTTILHWECYACEATLSLPEHTSITPEDAGHIDGTGREERCRWLVSRAALAAAAWNCSTSTGRPPTRPRTESDHPFTPAAVPPSATPATPDWKASVMVPVRLLRCEWPPNEGVMPGDARFDAVLASVREEGIRTPLTVNLAWRVLDGNHRLAAARLLGMERVPVRFWTETEFVP